MKKQRSYKKQTLHVSHINAIGTATAAFALTFSMMIASPGQLMFDTSTLMAQAVGARAAVAPNPDNTLAQELLQKEAELDQREARIAQMETPSASRQRTDNTWALASFALSFVLLILVAVNFYFDMYRRKSIPANQRFSINLRS